MGIFSRFERKVEDGVEGVAGALEKSALTPVQVTKKCEKQMKREKVVGAGKQIAPTLYTVLVSAFDDEKLAGYYPTLAGEVETYLSAKAREMGLQMDGKPLVRFVPDPDLKSGKFEVIAELVASSTILQLRAEENERYGIATPTPAPVAVPQPIQQPAPQPVPQPAPVQVPPKQPTQIPNAVPQAPVQVPNVERRIPDIPTIDDSGLDVSVQDEVVPQTATPVSAPVVPQVQQPAQQQQPQQEVYLYDEGNDVAYQLTGAPEKIGRESSNEIVVSDINASRVHAEIHMEPNGTWIVSDMGSTNGLYINGRRVKSAPLNDADIILIGTTRLEFQLLN